MGKMSGGIYIIICKTNENFYIGRSIDFSRRKRQHLSDLRKNKHKNQRLQSCFNKYGEDNILFHLLFKLPNDIHIQEEIEQMLIDLFISEKECLNLNKSGYGCHVEITQETKLKMS